LKAGIGIMRDRAKPAPGLKTEFQVDCANEEFVFSGWLHFLVWRYDLGEAP
jgi:hypothetical protein